MTNKEAAEYLQDHLLNTEYSEIMGEAQKKAIIALREVDAMAQELKEYRVVMPVLARHERELLAELNKEPDPETGLVPCGCGGKASLQPDSYHCYWVDCPKCDIQIGFWVSGDDHEPRGDFCSKTLARDA